MSDEEKIQKGTVVDLEGTTQKNNEDKLSISLQETSSRDEQEYVSIKTPLKGATGDSSPTFWKISHGTKWIKDLEDEFDKRMVAVVSKNTGAQGTRKVTQGDDFMYNMKKGDIFYLCWSSSIRLLCRIETDEVRENPEKHNGWYERNYAVIAKSLDVRTYKGDDKWWTPGHNSTCVPVPNGEEQLFEQLILKPYFNMTIDDVLSFPVEERNYWFLNANPNEWNLSKLAVCETQVYEFYSEDGHARRVLQNFKDAKIGDMVIGYETSPGRKMILAKLIISDKKDGESITFKKIEDISSPITYETLKASDELKNLQRFESTYESFGGSLFKLTKSEYEFIAKLIKDANTDKKNKSQSCSQVVKYKNSYSDVLVNSKNIIFHGAPGTGKTFLAMQIAADIISNGLTQEYKDLSSEQKEQIEFVQFHPSYDYTDFVEGLRPKLNNDGSMGFKLQDGIFKRFCAHAKRNIENSQKNLKDVKNEKKIDDTLNAFFTKVNYGKVEFTTITGNEFSIDGVDDDNIYITVPKNPKKNTIILNIKSLRDMMKPDNSFKLVKDITVFFKEKYGSQEDSYYFAIYNAIKKDMDAEEIEKEIYIEEKKKYVFIIDEINRGEISKIFGELFFSIDPGYRGHQGEVSTQYANLHSDAEEKFYVPENVYIIGTMNDIDRSVDTFDFAMRRRFRFIELKAKDRLEMLDQLGDEKKDAVSKLNKLNDAITSVEELNDNYQIGPSYFLKLKETNNDYNQLWTDYLEPLLWDYIRGMSGENETMDKFKKAYESAGEEVKNGENTEA